MSTRLRIAMMSITNQEFDQSENQRRTVPSTSSPRSLFRDVFVAIFAGRLGWLRGFGAKGRKAIVGGKIARTNLIIAKVARRRQAGA